MSILDQLKILNRADSDDEGGALPMSTFEEIDRLSSELHKRKNLRLSMVNEEKIQLNIKSKDYTLSVIGNIFQIKKLAYVGGKDVRACTRGVLDRYE